MTARLAAGIWVSAHIRRCEIEGAAAFVARKGAEESGAVLLKIARLDGTAQALTRATLGGGELLEACGLLGIAALVKVGHGHSN